MSIIAKIISGGQTGVDQAALRAAKALNIPTGGWAPKGWLTEAGPAPWLAEFGLREYDGGYAARTRANVKAAGMTLILVTSRTELTGGTALTLQVTQAALERGDSDQGMFVIGPDMIGLCRTAIRFAAERNSMSVLNVAGPRESKSPGIGALAEDFLQEVLKDQ